MNYKFLNLAFAATTDILDDLARSRKPMKSSWARSANSSTITEKCFRSSFVTSASTLAETDFKSCNINRPMAFAVSEYLLVSRKIKIIFPVVTASNKFIPESLVATRSPKSEITILSIWVRNWSPTSIS